MDRPWIAQDPPDSGIGTGGKTGVINRVICIQEIDKRGDRI